MTRDAVDQETFQLQLTVDVAHERLILYRALVVIELLALVLMGRQWLLG